VSINRFFVLKIIKENPTQGEQPAPTDEEALQNAAKATPFLALRLI
jgi:hypothetical protein